jgi:cysteine-S-conjugate beta-lyase
VPNPLAVLTTADLRQRQSMKWRAVDPDVLPAWIAEMDTPLADPIADALRRATDRGDTGYAHPGRLPRAFADYAERNWGWSPDPDRMLVVPDVASGIVEAILVTTAPGDGVLVNTPVYPPFFAFVAGSDRRIVESPLVRGADGRYGLDLEALGRDLARPDVTAYMLCNPHNPTGLVLTADEVAAVARLAHRHGVRLLADEVHAPLVYSGKSHTPMGTHSPSALVFAAASKAWNLPGLKASLIVATGQEAWEVLQRVPRSATFGTGLYGVLAGEAAFADGEAWLASLLGGLDQNRRLLAELLDEHVPGTGYAVPDATYLAWLDLRHLDLGEDPAAVMLERGRVALANGPAFGQLGQGFARLNFATSAERLAEIVRRMAAGL